MAYRYLVVEDSEKIRRITVDSFVEKGNGAIVVDEAEDGLKALDLIKRNDYDLVILDIMLPGVSGFEVCREIRKRSICPIIFVTALNSVDNLLKGYELGGDDYVTKPFLFKELFAKSEAIVKRYRGNIVPQKLVVDSIELFPNTMQVFVDGNEVNLSPKEYFILKLLMENKGHVFSRNALIDKCWDIGFDGGNRVVDTQIKKLRKNLGSSGKNIVTVIGGGYKIVSYLK